MARHEKISEEDVISKLKDDGDFDRLRLKIVRLLKHNEDLRNSIISAVKESAALNRAGAENMAPRQLCDAIHDEIRENVMKHISDGLWEIIQSKDIMRTEIADTVQSVYDKLWNTQKNTEGELPSSVPRPEEKVVGLNGSAKISGDNSIPVSNGGHKEHPDSSRHNHSEYEDLPSVNQQPGAYDTRGLEQREVPHESNGLSSLVDGDSSPPPGFLSRGKRKWDSDGNEEDPDIPPGFG